MAARSFGRGRFRKQVPTTLGRAPSLAQLDSIDLSDVRKPIDTSIFGLKQVLTLFETATDEVRRYIAYECDIIYECRTCRSLFRSLANFILHKRSFCHEIYEPVYKCKNADVEENSYEISSDTTNEEEVPETVTKSRKLTDVLKKLTQQQEDARVSEEIVRNELSLENPNETNYDSESKRSATVCLEKIENSNVGVFQTMPNESIGNDLMKSEVMEIHSILNNNEAILRPDGKAFSFQTDQISTNPVKPKLICSVCNSRFSTKKTLRYHVKYKHNDTRLMYTCPECKDLFANAWCVFRHLYKVHRKSTVQIRKLRDLVHSSCIVKTQSGEIKKDKCSIDNINNANRENQWLNNLEDDTDLQMCGGCGKRFERKAALHSHSQTCMKRMAVCNSIKKINEEKHSKQKLQNHSFVKGSKKRKPNILRKVVKMGDKRKENPKSSNESDKDQTAGNDMEKIQIEEVIFGNREVVTLDDKSEENRNEPIIILHSDDEDTFGFPSENEANNQNEMEENIEMQLTEGSKDTNINVVQQDEIDNPAEVVSCVAIEPDIQRNDLESSDAVQQEITKDVSNEDLDTNIETNIPKDVLDNLEIDLVINGIPQSDPDVIVDLTEDCLPENNDAADAADIPEEDNTPKIIEISPPVSNSNRSETSTPPLVVVESPEMLSQESMMRPQLIPKSSKKRKRTSDEISLKMKSERYVNWELLQCNSCNTSFKTNDCLMEHMALHFDWFRFQCGECSFVSYDNKMCMTHLQADHNIDPSISDSFVVPLPNWKAVKLSSDFKSLEPAIHKQLSDGDKSSDIGKLNKGDPMVRKMIMEVIFGPNTTPNVSDAKLYTSRSRNCVKMLDKDFVYDMNIVDTQIRHQAALENKVKPIKIVKSNESDFKVINLSPSQQKKKKCC